MNKEEQVIMGFRDILNEIDSENKRDESESALLEKV